MNLLLSKGFKLTKTHILHKQISLRRNGIEVDLHWQIGWMGNRLIDENLILRNYSSCKVGRIIVRIPNPTHELLLLLAHAILQHHYITLGETHYARALFKNHDIDWDSIFNISYKQRFYKGLIFLLSIIIAKDTLFYRTCLTRENANIEKFYLRTKLMSIPLTDILKPVIWLNIGHLPPSNILNFFEMIITTYRKLRYDLVGSLPYNEPLKGISSAKGFRNDM